MAAITRRTRFPPEPNGFLHLGHVKAMFIDFGRSEDCILRMDDTNPETETAEYVTAIKEDVEWMGYKPSRFTATSDYFDKLHEYACQLIASGDAYVDFTPGPAMREMRHAGEESTWRNATPEANAEEFKKMTAGHYEEGTATLRLKIDMKHNNHTLRDPVAYRICKTPHYKTGTHWCVYPSYDYSHGIVDALEGITHSYCTNEFFVRRELYTWPVIKLGLTPATVEEFGRLGIDGNVLSKRHINRYVREGSVSGYDDPRLLTIRGLRRRGWTSAALRAFISSVYSESSNEFALTDAIVGWQLMDFHLRSCWSTAPRAFAVVRPLFVVLDGCELNRECLHPRSGSATDTDTSHNTLLANHIFIEQDDYRETDDSNFYRVSPSNVVRLRWASLFIYGPHIVDGCLHMTAVADAPAGKKVRGTIHWVSEAGSVPALFEHYSDPVVDHSGKIRPESRVLHAGYVEKAVMNALDTPYQFERLGFYKFDRYEGDKPVFIRIVSLAESTSKK